MYVKWSFCVTGQYNRKLINLVEFYFAFEGRETLSKL